MFKKFLSYLIIFSILSADAAHCGGVFGRETPEFLDEEEGSNYTPVKRQTAEAPEGKTERTPLVHMLVHSGGEQDIPVLPPKFRFDNSSQGQSLASWTRTPSVGSINDSEDASKDEGAPSDALLTLLEDSNAENAVPQDDSDKGPVKTPEHKDLSHQHSSQTPHSPYQSETYSERTLQQFFAGFQREDTNNKRISSSSRRLLNEQSEDELKDFVVISQDSSDLSLDEFPDLSPEAKAFLTHVKKRIVDGELNWKQKAGILGSVALGAGVAWPWMCIMFDSLLKFYVNNVWNSVDENNVNTYKELNEKFQNLNMHLNFKTMWMLVGIPMGIATASQSASILMDVMKDRPPFFPTQRSQKHKWALLAAKGGAYVGALFPGLLSIYYLYRSLLRCDFYSNGSYDWHHNVTYQYGLSTDIFLNISTYTIIPLEPFYQNCTLTPDLPSKHLLFGIGGSFLCLSTVLRYGHQLTESVTKWIDDYFFDHISKSSQTSSVENIRQEYLTQFKALNRMICGDREDNFNNLYENIFNQETEKFFKKNAETFNINEAIFLLKQFKEFYSQHDVPTVEEDSENWKKTWASHLGWTISLIATMGRMTIFQYTIEQLLGTLWYEADVYSRSGYAPTLGTIIFSAILGYSLAHLSKGFVEKEAVEESIYEILGGKKIVYGKSHNTLRSGLKIWNYFYGIFQTFPYLIIGLDASYGSAFNDGVQSNMDQFGYRIDTRQILFLLSFGIADAFNNAITFHHSHFSLINALDSIKSYWAPSPDYKRDKFAYMTHQLHKLFKELHPDVLKEVDQRLGEDREDSQQGESESIFLEESSGGEFSYPTTKYTFRKGLLSHDTKSSEKTSFFESIEYMDNFSQGTLILHRQEADSVKDFILISQLPPEVRAFLRHVKIRIVDGELNGKQKAGIVGGLITGAAVAWPMMCILFDGLLFPYARYLFHYYGNYATNPDILKAQFENFNSYINRYTMMAMVGIPIGIDAASRTASIFIDYAKDNTQYFSLQKNRNHEWALRCAKASLFFSACFASLLPVYYLYESILGCNKDEGDLHYDKSEPYNVTVSRDIYLKLKIDINSTDYENCALQYKDLPPENFRLFGVGATFLFLDTFLQYGHQLSHHAECWINDYFFNQMCKSSPFSFSESLRQKYLTQFKTLQRTIDGLDEKDTGELYEAVFKNKEGEKITQNYEFREREQFTEAIRVLSIFNNFHPQYEDPLGMDEPKNWKKTLAKQIGWALPLIATFGRMIIFQYTIEESFKAFGWHNHEMSEIPMGATILSVILGGIFANLAQGFIEKDGVEKGVYEILGGKKTSEGRSYNSLRTGIKVWDYIYGIFHTLPYLMIGRDASEQEWSIYEGAAISLDTWQYPLLITFGLADAFNSAIAFHESNLRVVNTYDSLQATYWSPTPEYKRDKLIRIVRELRKLFKELDPDVLQTVDRLLNQDAREDQQNGFENLDL